MTSNSYTGTDAGAEDNLDEELIRATVKLNTWILAGVFGCISGLSLCILTYLSLYSSHPDTGHFLNLLGVFMPGYEVSHAGAWIGLFWGALLGALLAALFYRVYARSIGVQIERYCDSDINSRELFGATLLFDANYLGLALGAVVACGLIITTNWLVFRGTADHSVHAMLLVNYLPGYTISLTGSFVGALELFGVTYLMCLLFSRIYNGVVFMRGRGK